MSLYAMFGGRKHYEKRKAESASTGQDGGASAAT